MSGKQFLRKLAWSLRGLKRAERKKYIRDYAELLADMTENGMTEQEAVEKLGDIKKIRGEIMAGRSGGKHLDIPGILLIAVTGLLGVLSILQKILGRLVLGPFTIYEGAEDGTAAIIGGADGPTSIFLAGKPGIFGPYLLYIAAGIFLLATILYFVWKNRRTRR